jgi:signal transduction histidine kinase
MDHRGIVLLVDDEEVGRMAMAALLHGLGHELAFASGGREAIEKAVQLRPDLILLDVMMPDMDGYEVCRRVRSNAGIAEVPILLMTSLDDRASRLKGLEAGADDLVSRPFDRAEMRTRIQTIIRLNRFRRLQDEIDRLRRAEQEVVRGREQLSSLTRRLLQAQEEERRSIARELHDEVGQVLTVLKMNLSRTRKPVGEPTRSLLIEDSIQLVEQLIGQVRDLWKNLRPSLLDEQGLPEAIRVLAEQTAARTDLEIQTEIDSGIERFDPGREIACYRVAQESLTNVVRHARASRVRIWLSRSARRLELRVEDDGVGFEVEEALRQSARFAHMGLLGMRERASCMGGVLMIDSSPGRGTRVTVFFPWGFNATEHDEA